MKKDGKLYQIIEAKKAKLKKKEKKELLKEKKEKIKKTGNEILK